MSLNPEDRKNWQGFLDLLQPPPNYRLVAALGTTFGLSIDALVAALLSMCDADGEEISRDPVAATMAITRLSAKVRVLVQPATTSGPQADTAYNGFIAMLDRLVVEVQPASGLFHPKVWALRFEHVGPPKGGAPTEIGRVLVGSRNLTRSSSFELGVAFEGVIPQEGANASDLARDIARAFRGWIAATKVRYPKSISELPTFVERLAFDLPHEASASIRLIWQGMGRKPLVETWPIHLTRAVVVSPFIQPDFVEKILTRTKELHIVSIPESLDALPDDTIAALDARAKTQKSAVLYQITDHGDPEDSHIDGVHAKILLLEDNRQQSTMYVAPRTLLDPAGDYQAQQT